jgi:hypothetical protein
VLELTTWFSEDMLKEDLPRNSSSMRKIKPSDLNNGRTML